MNIKPASDCAYDIVTLGEVMLRLDPGERRIRTARQFDVWEGGGEYNVGRGLNRCFGLRAAHVTALTDNDVGRLIENLIMAGGVDTSHIRWHEFDGIGRSHRNGLNFTERGFGVRAAKGVSDRGHTSAAQLQTGDIDWEHLFGELGARWFHTGGIFAGLSPTTPAVIEEAMQAAKKHGTIISYDLNFRASLWDAFGGSRKCQEINRRIAPWVDVMLGNEEDFSMCLGLQLEGVDENLMVLPSNSYSRMIEEATGQFENLQLVATTLRTVHTATVNDWTALAWYRGHVHESRTMEKLEILDRVGGGDSFAAGLIFGWMETGEPQQALEYGVAHGALAMTTPGDTSMVTRDEVESLVLGQSRRVKR